MSPDCSRCSISRSSCSHRAALRRAVGRPGAVVGDPGHQFLHGCPGVLVRDGEPRFGRTGGPTGQRQHAHVPRCVRRRNSGLHGTRSTHVAPLAVGFAALWVDRGWLTRRRLAIAGVLASLVVLSVLIVAWRRTLPGFQNFTLRSPSLGSVELTVRTAAESALLLGLLVGSSRPARRTGTSVEGGVDSSPLDDARRVPLHVRNARS